MADGLVLRVVSTTGGPVHKLGVALAYPDYFAWCGGRLVYVAGKDRVAIHAKRLLAASPPDWRPSPLWDDGTRLELDAPPPGWADEAPRWSRDGRSLLFVRERKGYGRVMLLRDSHVLGPVANLGFGMGFYGHHDWQLSWSVGA